MTYSTARILCAPIRAAGRRLLRPLATWLCSVGLVMLAALLLGRAAEAAPVRTDHATAELIAEQPATAGGTVTLALRLTPDQGWHSYWRNPGDTGLPTTIAWTLPAGVEAGPIDWPFPEAIAVPPYMNFGYAHESWLLTRLTLPARLEGSSLTIKARADWLICETVCVPDGADLTLDLPVVTAGSDDDLPDSRYVLGFERARAKLPQPASFTTSAARQGETAVITITGADLPAPVRFFPDDGAVIVAAADQPFDGHSLRLILDKGFAGQRLSGVLVAGAANGTKAYQVTMAVAGSPPPASSPAIPSASISPAAAGAAPVVQPAEAPPATLLVALGLALLGGLILNIMPCVLPVLSIKALQLVGRDLAAARREALAYTLGVLLSFGVLGGLLLALRSAGAAIGWGFQLQNPVIVALLADLFLLIGFNLIGVLPIGGRLAGVGQGLAGRGGVLGSFFTGALAVVAATPCTAPFMGGAVGAALVRPAVEALVIFLALGLGFALPFLAIALIPLLARLLPRPGLWMVRLKEFLAFPMFASTAWLVWVATVGGGTMALAGLLSSLVLLTLAAWMWRSFSGSGGRLTAAAALLGGLALAFLPLRADNEPMPGRLATSSAEAYSADRLAQLRQQGKPVFVNLTAAWCITCLVNETVALDRPAVQAALAERKVTYMIGDWTRQDPAITALLARHGRSGVPLYLLFPGNGGPARILPQILTEAMVIDALNGL